MPPSVRNRHAPLTVLLVDDEALFRSVARSMLTLLGFDVIEAEDGFKALQWVQQGQPLGLVLCDFRMPAMDGVATLKALGMLRPGLKAILTSGMSEQDCLQGRTLEHCVYLGKPFGLHDLDAAVNRVLDPVAE